MKTIKYHITKHQFLEFYQIWEILPNGRRRWVIPPQESLEAAKALILRMEKR